MKEPQPLGDSALLFAFDEEKDPYTAAQRVVAHLVAHPPVGVRDAAAAYTKVAVYFDPLLTEPEQVAAAVRIAVRAAQGRSMPDAPVFEIPVVYDGADLDHVTTATGLARDEVVRLHAGREYRAHAVGFVPGFAYLGDLDEQLRIARRKTPRTRVPAGAVAIAGAHTAVYPFATPGGWHLIGRTKLQMFDADRDPPALLQVGTVVRFVPA